MPFELVGLMPRSIVPPFYLVSLILLMGHHFQLALAARDQFKKRYPEFGFIFDRILHTNCTEEYDTYYELFDTLQIASSPAGQRLSSELQFGLR